MARKEKKTIAVVLYPGMTALDLVGSMETLMVLNLNSPYRMVTVAERLEPVQTDAPLKMVPNRTFADVPAPFGLIVPGGGAAAMAAGRDEVLNRYVRSAGETAELVASIGTGSLILAAAGLLEGRQATTHWEYARDLEELGARYTRQRWVEDGKFITAAGVTAGIDMSLYLVAKLTSFSKARRSQLIIEYDPQPPYGGIDWEQVERDATETGVATDAGGDRAAHGDARRTSTMTKEQVSWQ